MRILRALALGAILLAAPTAARSQAFGEPARIGGAPKPPAVAPRGRAAARPQARPAQAARIPAALPDSARLLRLVRELADPGLEGRGVGTAGLEQAADLVEQEMRALGLAPAGDDGTWDQPFEVTTGAEVGRPTSLALDGTLHPAGGAFEPLGFSTNGTLTAPVVFAGYGITAPGYDYDDYAGLEVATRSCSC